MHSHNHRGTYDHASHSDHNSMLRNYERRLIVSTLLTIPILILSPSVQGFAGYNINFSHKDAILWLLSTIIYVYGGYPFLKGLMDEIRHRLPGMMTLIGIAISVAYLYSTATLFILEGRTFFWELATLIDIMLLGHIIEMKSVMEASKALELLAKMLPAIVHLVKEEGIVVDVPIEKVRSGSIILVKPGERIPVDGIVIEGRSSVNESMITGESVPVPKEPGHKVLAGTVNLEGSLIIRAEKVGSQTYLAQVVELVKRIQRSKSRAQDLANRAAKWLTIIALGGGFLTFIAWIGLGYDSSLAIERAVTVMVIACPHALGLAVPLVIARSTALAAMNGILIRNRIGFEKARGVSMVVFDKTGTLTKGELSVTKVLTFTNLFSETDVVSMAASLETRSEHPIAQAIVEYAKRHNYPLYDIEKFEALPGKGVKGIINSRLVHVVGSNYLREANSQVYEKISKQIRDRELAGTITYVVVDEKPVGAILLEDKVRKESREAVQRLKEMGIEVAMLTGDNRYIAERVAKELGIERVYAEVLPHEKVTVIKELRKKGHKVAMVGDGVNDAPALMEADVGIAIGAGTDIAIESADIVLVKNDPRDVPRLLELSHKTSRKIRQNLLWATGYNAFAIPLAAGAAYRFSIVLQPAVGALLMAMSTVIVAINALLLK